MSRDLFQTEKNAVLEASRYADFKKALAGSDCRKCALCQSRTNIVVDRGNPETDVMVVGEGPGRHEDLEGKAFVGRSGKLLDAMLKDLGFDTNEACLIANVVKCRPPENRQPKPAEAEACRPFLEKQIALVKPKIILLLGATALKRLIRPKAGFSMGETAGKFFEHAAYPGIRFMVLYHPAFILRNPRQRRVLQEHLKRFVSLWRQLGADPVRPHAV